jgi:hypothetical protein
VQKKVASVTITSFGRKHKFHFATISDTWFKIDVCEAHAPIVVLMFQNEMANQEKVKDMIGTSIIWDQKYMKSTSCE